MDDGVDDVVGGTTWRVGDQEILLPRKADLPITRNGWVMLLADVLSCSLDEAAQTYDDFFANSDFVRSVLDDIDRLPEA